MKGKRIGTSVLAALMLAGTTATSALAAMPDRTVVIGEKAFTLAFANDEANEEIISKAAYNAIKAGKEIYVKSRNMWYKNDETKLTDTSVIPAVVYRTAEAVEVNYEAGDGEEVTEGFAIKEISATAKNEITVSFTEAVEKADRDKAEFVVKKAKGTKTWEKITWNDEGTEAVITLEARIIDGEYSVAVNGLDLEDNTRTFTGERERVEGIEFVSAESVPYISVAGTKEKVIVNYKIVDQYGDETKLGSVQINGGYGKAAEASKERYQTTFMIPDTLFSSPLVKEIPMSVNIVVTDNNKVVSENKMFKIVRPAEINEVKIGQMYVVNADGDKLVEASSVVESPDSESAREIYLALNATTQYGEKVDKTFIQNRLGTDVVPIFGTATGDTNEDKDIKNITQFKNFSVTPSGIAGTVEKELYFNTLDTTDKTLYLKLTGEFKSNIPANVMVFAGSDSDTETIAVDASANLAQLSFSFPEIVSGKEVVELTEVEAYNQNGEAMKDKDLYKIIKTSLNEGETKIITPAQGSIDCEYDEVKEKLTITWTAPNNPAKNGVAVDIPVAFTVRTQTNEYTNMIKNVKPNAVVVQATMNKDALMKFVAETTDTNVVSNDDLAKQIFTLGNITAYDQYGRKMSTKKLYQAIKADANKVKIYQVVPGVDNNPATEVEVDAEEYTIAGTTQKSYYYEITASRAVRNDNYKIKVDLGNDKVDETIFRVANIKADEIKTIEMSAPEVVYGGEAPTGLTAANYKQNFSVFGKTKAGDEIKLVRDRHYELTIPSAMVEDAVTGDNPVDAVSVELFTVEAGKIVAAPEVAAIDSDTERASVFGSKTSQKKGYTLFAVASVGDVAEPAAKNIELTDVAPTLTTFKLYDDKKVQKLEKNTMNMADIKDFFTIEDQYGVQWQPDPTYVFIQNAKFEDETGKENPRNITGLVDGDSFELRVYYGQKFEVVKVIVDTTN